MQKVVVFLAVLFSNLILSQTNIDEPKKVVEDFFIAFHAKDTIAMKKVCHSNMILHTVTNSEKDTRLKEEPTEVFFKSFSQIPEGMTFYEKILSYKVQIDGNLAHVWTPYEVYINGKLLHGGVNSFTMIKEPNGEWKIVHLIDTRRKP